MVLWFFGYIWQIYVKYHKYRNKALKIYLLNLKVIMYGESNSPPVEGCAARRGVVWCGVVWCGVVWCGVVWCGVPPVL
jgi:hypothetical protein